MDRRTRTIVIAAVVAMLVLVLAASSGSSPIWESPSTDDSGGELVGDPPAETIQPQEPVEEGRRHPPGWFDAVARILAVVLAAGLALVAIGAATLTVLPSLRRPSIRRRRRDAVPLPEVDERVVELDVVAARAALATGTPRNAIVACWMQLESDAEQAGLPRLAAETPTEYVERVIAHSSVDRAPIAELAGLYREARFSRHELGDDHRARAVAALDRVAAALGHDAEALP